MMNGRIISNFKIKMDAPPNNSLALTIVIWRQRYWSTMTQMFDVTKPLPDPMLTRDYLHPSPSAFTLNAHNMLAKMIIWTFHFWDSFWKVAARYPECTVCFFDMQLMLCIQLLPGDTQMSWICTILSWYFHSTKYTWSHRPNILAMDQFC